MVVRSVRAVNPPILGVRWSVGRVPKSWCFFFLFLFFLKITPTPGNISPTPHPISSYVALVFVCCICMSLVLSRAAVSRLSTVVWLLLSFAQSHHFRVAIVWPFSSISIFSCRTPLFIWCRALSECPLVALDWQDNTSSYYSFCFLFGLVCTPPHRWTNG